MHQENQSIMCVNVFGSKENVAHTLTASGKKWSDLSLWYFKNKYGLLHGMAKHHGINVFVVVVNNILVIKEYWIRIRKFISKSIVGRQ